jgi:heptose-I-phosphate ethanolaminephosphotransferase
MVRRQKKGELIRFDDVITPWNVTSNAFKSFLSTHADDEKGLWADGVLFPALFKKAGYHVSFFTQQFMKSSRLAAADFNGSFFLNDAELDSLCFDTRNKLKWTQDNGLIKEYGKHKGDYTDRNLFIFHLLGQHVEYKQRFPKAQEFFTIDNYKDRNDLSKAEKYIVADYDNATRYNDNVVDGIINLFVNEDAIVIYMPDHAEEVYDEIHAFGRLHDANLSPSLVRQEFEIPLAVWCSKKFRRRHRSEFKKLKSISKRPYKTDDIAHFMIGLAGIHTPFYNAERDWASDSYKLHPRIIKHTADYDSIMSSEKK